MHTTPRAAIVLVVLALAGTTSGSIPAATGMRAGIGAELEELETASVLIIVGGSPEQRGSVEWAASRFVDAGLELPPILVEFVGPSLAPCGGAHAMARMRPGKMVVTVCWGTPFILLHELAHVWVASSVSSDQRRRFVETRIGVTSWADPDDQWAERGREHAANVIAWALMADPMVVGRTYPNDRESLEAGFEILTARQPLHDSGGEPIIVERTSGERKAAKQEAALRGGIQSGR